MKMSIALVMCIFFFLACIPEVYSQSCADNLSGKSTPEELISCIQQLADSSSQKNVIIQSPIVKISFAQGKKEHNQNPINRDIEPGLVQDRSLRFHKERDDTLLRISYTDNMKVDSSPLGARKGNRCIWEIRINDDKPCDLVNFVGHQNAQGLLYDIYSEANVHRSQNLVGYCHAQKGETTIRVQINDLEEEQGDCATGHKDSVWMLEVMEVISDNK